MAIYHGTFYVYCLNSRKYIMGHYINTQRTPNNASLETPARHCRAQLGGGQLPSPLEFFIYVVDALLL